MSFYSPEALEEIYEKYSADIADSSVSNLVPLVKAEFENYKEAVANFFTDKADEIRYIYKSIRENKYPYNRITASDSNRARHFYLEYYDGLKEYIERLIDIKPSDELDPEKIGLALEKVKDRDNEFIDSIYTEAKNPSESMDIDSAMKNIEVLIDVYNESDSMLEDLGKFLTEAGADCNNETTKGLKLMANSIRHYHKGIIKKILECYEKIHDSIQTRTPVSGEPVIETYQLF